MFGIPVIRNFNQILHHPLWNLGPEGQLDYSIHNKKITHPIYSHVDHSWSRYTNFQGRESTNCVEGILLRCYDLQYPVIREFSQEMLKDGELLKKLGGVHEQEQRFFRGFLEECIRLTSDDEVNKLYDPKTGRVFSSL